MSNTQPISTAVSDNAEARPQVVIPGGAVTVTESARKLYEAIAPSRKLFVKDDKVTQLKRDANGMVYFHEVTPSSACSLLEGFVHFVKPKRNMATGWTAPNEPTVLTKQIAEMYLQCEQKSILPVIHGIVNCPLITERHQSLHVLAGGYDESTHVYVNASHPLPQPSLDDAIDLLPHLLDDFDFQTPGDRSRALAEIITPALKFGGFFSDPVPLFVAEADKSQSGKSYRQHMTAAVYGEFLDTVSKKDARGVGSLDESLSTLLVRGRPFIQLDNVRGKIDSAFLEAFTTARGSIEARPAYSKTVPVDPTRHFLFINSNGFQATKDLVNRSVIVRIRKRENWDFKDMLGFIRKNQPLVLAWVFEIIKEWHRRGKQRTSELRHDFREWCQIVDWIIQNIFGEAPLMEGHDEAQGRASSVCHTFIREVALMLETRRSFGHAFLAGEIGNLCRSDGITIPFLSHEQRDDDERRGMAIGKVMAELLPEGQDEMTVDAFRITRQISRATGESGKAFDRKTYTFRKSAE